jgi:c(7)-type cytochrome triheme protein
MKRAVPWILIVAFLQWAAPDAFAQDQSNPRAIYELSCVGCHGTGVLGAPKLGDTAQWAPRAKAGIDVLVRSAIAGTDKGMPPKGGRPDLSPIQLRAVIEYMMAGGSVPAKAVAGAVVNSAVDGKPPVEGKPSVPPKITATVAATTTRATATAPLAAATTTAPPRSGATPAPAVATTVATRTAAINPPSSNDVNSFNRLLKPPGRFNRPAVESGIHDPTNDMTLELQSPATAFSGLPQSMAGNHIDWVKSLNSKAIMPRWDRLNPAAPALVMDLNIVREVKGSMPDVVFPHKQHTEWLDCSNCHPAIFIPQKGANQISMASILLGQKCGVCHGKVAFPVSECRLCHSKKKIETTTVERKP